jgi:hypothetical protein
MPLALCRTNSKVQHDAGQDFFLSGKFGMVAIEGLERGFDASKPVARLGGARLLGQAGSGFGCVFAMLVLRRDGEAIDKWKAENGVTGGE